jgi:FAD/FMN-containing dehydrogenase
MLFDKAMKHERLTGWGNYLSSFSRVLRIKDIDSYFDPTLRELCNECIAIRGNGRSYGDSSLGPLVVDLTGIKKIYSFDKTTGLLSCSSGITIGEIQEITAKFGWIVAVTPGTKHVTVGGAIACDIHGKNHHIEGAFSNFVLEIELLGVDGGSKVLNRWDDLFFATCGGMGLTGLILTAKIQLKKIQSTNLAVVNIKTNNIFETLECFEKFSKSNYSVAWMDCTAVGNRLGKSIFSCAEHLKDGIFEYPKLKESKIIFKPPTSFGAEISIAIDAPGPFTKFLEKNSKSLYL